MRKHRHHRARRGILTLPAPEQLALPFEWLQLASAYRTRNPSRWTDRPARPLQGRLVTKRAKPAQTYIAPVSSFLDNIKEKVRQRHPFWLTSPIAANMIDVIQNGWHHSVSAFPPFDSGADPEFGSGRSHVDRRGRRSLPPNPLVCHWRRAELPGVRHG
jgi:hypothetical protein